jgi:hypothetical protein
LVAELKRWRILAQPRTKQLLKRLKRLSHSWRR